VQSPKWRVPEDWQLEWRQWGSLHVVFNPASGDTHLLNAASASVLRSLERNASTVEALEARTPDSSDVSELVSELDELGLIAPAHD
jgi:PqqD family protein of HPr-rel-A system